MIDQIVHFASDGRVVADEAFINRLPYTMKEHAQEIADLLNSVSSSGNDTKAPSPVSSADIDTLIARLGAGLSTASGDRTSAVPAATFTAPTAPSSSFGSPSTSSPPAARTPSASPAGQPPPSDDAEVLADYTQTDKMADLIDEFSEVGYAQEAPTLVGLQTRLGSDGVRLRWNCPDSSNEYAVYRVLASDADVPFSSATGDVLLMTLGRTFTDTRPAVSAVRHYQVWQYLGRDREDAAWATPTLVAQHSVVFGPQDVDVHEDGSQVVGRWRVLPGASGVQIYRIPSSLASQAGSMNPAYQIAKDSDNSSGFVDSDGETGGSYVYQLVAQARVNGIIQLSDATTVKIYIRPKLEHIEDLACQKRVAQESVILDLMWTTPKSGEVRVFRTSERPQDGIDREPIPVSAFSTVGLDDSDDPKWPIASDGEMSKIVGLPWKEGWLKTYLTPVHVVEDRAWVGKSVVVWGEFQVGDPAVHQRVDFQMVTFGWPKGADGDVEFHAHQVSVFAGAPDATSQSVLMGEPLVSVSADDYATSGGVTLPHRLPARGARVFLVPYAHAGLETVTGQESVLDYPGLLRVDYSVSVKRRLLQRRWTLEVKVRADATVAPSPGFALVFRPDRLPLALTDGDQVPLSIKEIDDSQPALVWRFDQGIGPEDNGFTMSGELDRTGFVRLFAVVNTSQRQILAVVDPGIETLQCQE